ncbi:MAG: hypothetical protein ACRDF0_05815 [Candidatus Limnocylindria bacterium]
MRSGGFPCRFAGCDVRYGVLDQSSMDALLAASARRSEHEVSAHGYRHQRLDEQAPRVSFASSLSVRKPQA